MSQTVFKNARLVLANEVLLGSVQAIVLETGYFFGGADPRRPGAAARAP